MFDTDLYKSYLRTDSLGQKIIYTSSTDSTNDSIWVSDYGIDSGVVLVAEEQTNGRGRNGHTWFSSARKSLTFSILSSLDEIDINKGMVPIAIGLCICESINESIENEASIKWPNDILIEGKKVCGVLCETKMINRTEYISIGIGININQLSGDFPLSLVDNVTSLAIAGGAVVRREKFLAVLINNIETMLSKRSPADLKALWRAYCDHSNKSVVFNSHNRRIAGEFAGISNNGEALVMTGGRLETVSSGVIEYDKPSD